MKRTRCSRLLLALAAAAMASAASAASIKISCGAVGQELELCRRNAEAWAQKTGNQVQVVATPNDSSERLALYQQVLSAGSDKIDVFQIDVVWPGLLGLHLLDLKPYTQGVEGQHFASFIANNTHAGRLVAMPWFANAGLLFYRKDLLDKHGQKVPATWDELAATAKKVQDAERAAGNDKMWGYVWQGRAYEGLTCNALEWVASHGGGTVVDSDGRISIRNANAAAALRTAASWVGTISPTAVLNYAEEESRGVFQAGNAVFMRNWPYAWSLAQGGDSVIKGKVGVAVLPRGTAMGGNAATLGGESLAVSKYTRNPALAADLVLYMTSAAVQKERALSGSFNPTLPALYRDAEILKANPFMGELYGVFNRAVARPTSVTGARYNQVSNEFWNAVHEVLAGGVKPDEALSRLDTSLNRLSRGAKW
ncbi:MAG TPA: ABC transporter substrate-binding protein [Burkholderiaceae bacterium]|nr:ABC transporter substrate-binding protein [Burkholderiaceae bacterium]